MRVALYARVSTESQEARGTIGSQLAVLKDGSPRRDMSSSPSSATTGTRAPASTGPASTPCGMLPRPGCSRQCGVSHQTDSPVPTHTRCSCSTSSNAFSAHCCSPMPRASTTIRRLGSSHRSKG